MTILKITSILPLIFSFLILCYSPLKAQNISGDEEAFIFHKNDAGLEWASCPEFMPDDCRLAVLQGDPAGPNADVFFKLQGNSDVANHWHTSAERMILVSGELRVDYEGQDPVVMKPGTYAYGPAELPHTTSCVSDEPCLLFIAFEEPVDATEMD
ncbi:cupin domain-containing protein [Rhodohalobacter sp. SW132]|uniref:cupin domain-containing protein n=1 Tax=Rhodohalobacter sp. SW132 TaxID=2293433 RepID=UPI000E2631AF|nr:cupin domain-containing protein [Rhodohalobacter sp. SW132]REL39315.1 cupin domain-containing protein [Rhodohalobacter sp. SW132]